jgi:nitrate reductase NapE component
MKNCKMRRSMKMKEIMKKNEIITILFINLHVYEKLNCLMND